MGGGDLNMKKSWHPLLLKNQERVWLEEKKALEEKKKLDTLRKEKEEERQLQELQRLQEEQTGKKRTEKLEWMYTTPASGSSQNQNDLEDYLLGKKRVDKILTADENAKVGASHKNFIAVQNANSARDLSAKIREDPLLAIKQQEQAAYEALMANPLRLREMQERNGIKPKKDKKDKEQRKREKEEKRRLKQERKLLKSRQSRSPSPLSYHRRRSPSGSRSSRSRSPFDRRPSPLPSRYDDRRHSRDRGYSRRDDSRSRSPRAYRPRESRSPVRNGRGSDEHQSRTFHQADFDRGPGGRGRSPERFLDHGKRARSRSRGESNSYPKRSRMSPPPPRNSRPAEPHRGPPNGNDDRAARLAAMSAEASTMSVERQERLQKLLEKEKAELAAEEEARAKSKGMGGFLSHEQKKVFGGVGGLEERIKRGRGGMVVDGE